MSTEESGPADRERADGRLDDKTVKLLQKALAISPEDWETRAHLLAHFLATRQIDAAKSCFAAAPTPPGSEAEVLLQARLEAESDPAQAIRTLTALLQRNKACARAYWQLAQIYRREGLKEEARKKYGAAVLLDEALADREFEAWLGDTAVPADPEEEGRSPAAVDTDGGVEELSGEEIAAAVRDATSPVIAPITFADIGGMKEVIERIRMNIIYPFKNPEVFRKFNRRAGGGILLYGPPGCGKTHIARATAGECNAAFISIGITDVLSRWHGESERHLHELFETARRRAPAVVFIDEIDAIGVSRSDASAVAAPIVNVLLTEMDGIASDNTNVMVLGATNSPWRVDAALRRPGRFDRVLFVPPPDEAARAAILDINLRDVPHESVDTAKLARQAEKFSGADLRAAVLRAGEQAIMAEMKTGRSAQISQAMLAAALKETRPSTVEWLETARNYASYANRAGLYDELVEYFERH